MHCFGNAMNSMILIIHVINFDRDMQKILDKIATENHQVGSSFNFYPSGVSLAKQKKSIMQKFRALVWYFTGFHRAEVSFCQYFL